MPVVDAVPVVDAMPVADAMRVDVLLHVVDAMLAGMVERGLAMLGDAEDKSSHAGCTVWRERPLVLLKFIKDPYL